MLESTTRALFTACLLLSLFAPTNSNALTFTLDVNFGSQPASGSISLEFVDSGLDTVTLTIDSSGLSLASEFIKEIYFSYDGDATSLGFGAPSGSAAASLLSTSTAVNQTYQADGDGKYNVWMKFDPANANRFNINEQLEIDITLLGLVAEDFNIIGAIGEGTAPFTPLRRSTVPAKTAKGATGSARPDLDLDRLDNPFRSRAQRLSLV